MAWNIEEAIQYYKKQDIMNVRNASTNIFQVILKCFMV